MKEYDLVIRGGTIVDGSGAPRLIADCVFDGYRLAREFESNDPQYPKPWIRKYQVWGRETFPKLVS